MIETQKEKLSINKLVAEKREIIFAEGDMIVPDSKPDILNTICTSGVVSIYKKEVQEEKMRIDGTINTYIMYMPDGSEDTVRGLNASLDFSENIGIQNCKEGMDDITDIKIKSIEAKVLNGRKISIKATLEANVRIYSKEEVEIINNMENADNIQILKEDLTVNSLVGSGETKIYAKDNIPIDSIDNLAEILKAEINLVDKDIKISYNKVLTKAEAEVTFMYLTEDNRINKVTYKIPVVGFIDIQDVTEENLCDVNYEIRNIVIKPNSQEEHSIYVEIEIQAKCSVYEIKQINLIQDMYSPTENLNFETKQILTMTEKQSVKNIKQIREKINLKDIENESLIDVDVEPNIINENKINTKILYEGEMNLRFIFVNQRMQIDIKETKIPFEYTVENLQNGESLNTNNCLEIKSKDFIIQDGGDINCNIDMETNTNMYRTANINMIDSIQEDGEREEQDYSIMMYIVKKGDTLWKIAKEFGSTIDGIARVNGIEDKNLIFPGQKLFIPKYTRITEKTYE
ncbi:lysM repeat-containing protein [Clostridium sp. CAG:575]|nr:lysM repeat-containing protein [Clostridium sp. CAG:575]